MNSDCDLRVCACAGREKSAVQARRLRHTHGCGHNSGTGGAGRQYQGARHWRRHSSGGACVKSDAHINCVCVLACCICVVVCIASMVTCCLYTLRYLQARLHTRAYDWWARVLRGRAATATETSMSMLRSKCPGELTCFHIKFYLP
jgi:hypothetical protein